MHGAYMVISAQESSTKEIRLSYILRPKRQRKQDLSAVQGI